MSGSVVWLTGVSGAGKTTIAEAILARLKPVLPELVLVDGDVVRELFGAGLGYHEAARIEQIGRIQRLARMLSAQGLVVIVAALYANRELLAWNRASLPGYFEVHVDAPMDLVRARDVKGLYARADAGLASHVVGIDIPWHPPEAPDLVIDATAGEAPGRSAARVISSVPALAAAEGRISR
jgi:adenylylsulfate kinase-like enzyme